MEKEWEKKLRASGRRMTKTRLEIMRIFEKGVIPISIDELAKQLKKENTHVDIVTLYRQVDTLVQEGILEQSDLPGKKAMYEEKRKHHHHFLCRKCKTIQCLEHDVVHTSLHGIVHHLEKTGVRVEGHSFSLSGLCRSCSQLD